MRTISGDFGRLKHKLLRGVKTNKKVPFHVQKQIVKSISKLKSLEISLDL